MTKGAAMRNFFLFVLLFATVSAYADATETVLVTYHPKAGKETEMLRILRDEWSTLTKLSLVTGGHQLYRGESEAGTVIFVEIFTWKSNEIPDHAPAEVRKIWAEMNANTDKLDFFEIKPISVESSPPAAAPLK